MKAYFTKIRAINPRTGKLEVFEGSPIFADSKEDATRAVLETQPYAEVWMEAPAGHLLNKILKNDKGTD